MFSRGEHVSFLIIPSLDTELEKKKLTLVGSVNHGGCLAREDKFSVAPGVCPFTCLYMKVERTKLLKMPRYPVWKDNHSLSSFIIVVSVWMLPLKAAIHFHFLEMEMFTFVTPTLCFGKITGPCCARWAHQVKQVVVIVNHCT